jgi:hypothetical protein
VALTLVGLISVAIALGVLTAIFALSDVGGWGYFLFGSVISVIIVWAFAPFMPQRTKTGAQEQRKWEAFRNYLDDLTRFQDMASAQDHFEKYLAYAIAFGVEKQWVRRFEGLNVPSPTWYHPPIFIPLPSGGPTYGGPLDGPRRWPRGTIGGGMGVEVAHRTFRVEVSVSTPSRTVFSTVSATCRG